MEKEPHFFSQKVEFGLITMVLLLSALMRLLYLSKNVLDYDEGHWLMFGTLANRGYAPYTDLFVGIPPLALIIIQFSAYLFGSNLAVRLPMMLYSLVGIWAIYWLVKQQVSPLAGLLAAVLLSFQPNYFFQSVSLMTEVPSLALALLAVALVEKYRQSKSGGWLIAAGAISVACLLMKFFVIFLPLLIGLQLLSISLLKDPVNQRWQLHVPQLVKTTAIWLLGSVLILLPFIFIYNPWAMYTEVLEFRFLLREAKFLQEGITTSKNLNTVLITFVNELILLIGAAAISLVIFITKQPKGLKRTWLWPAWFLLAFLVLANQIPFRERYIVMTVPPLVALIGVGGAQIIRWVSQNLSPNQLQVYRPAIFGFLVVLLIMLIKPVQAFTAPPEESWLDAREVGRRAAAAFVHRISGPDDCIVVDDQRFAFLSERMVPPFLSETSTARLQVDWLTSSQVADITDMADCVALVYISDRFFTYLPDLATKANQIFTFHLTFADTEKSRATRVYVIPYKFQITPSIALDYSLGEVVNLIGIDITPGPWQAGQEISLSTYWEAQKPIQKDYKIFVHILDATGETLATLDHYPFETKADDYILAIQPTDIELFQAGYKVEDFKNYPAAGMLPTRLWQPNQTVRETITVNLPNSLPPGNYDIALGLYDEASGKRLTITHGNAIVTNNEIVVKISGI